jgi:very-short-patch-repair endonuclease
MPMADEVNAASPMERKVLHWLGQVPLIRELDGDCEILANFELGRYLRQLDPTYNHPDYRVDFLILISVGDRQHQLVLEYDGFEYHFVKDIPSEMINSSTWQAYLTEHDLEREKVLESFGYPMLRLNRFNLGKNPVATIDSMLRERLETMLNDSEPHELVKKDAATASEIEEGLKTGGYKRCKKCDRDLPIQMFNDNSIRSGVGRLCRECKTTTPSNYRYPKFGRRYRRW